MATTAGPKGRLGSEPKLPVGVFDGAAGGQQEQELVVRCSASMPSAPAAVFLACTGPPLLPYPTPHLHPTLTSPSPSPPTPPADDSDDGDSSLGGSAGGPPSPSLGPAAEEVVVGEGMRGAQMLVWLGDFNYRIDGSYEAVKEHAIRNELAPLLELVRGRWGHAWDRGRSGGGHWGVGLRNVLA